MSNKNFFFNSKLLYNLKSNNFIILILLFILLIIIFFVNYDSLFKIIEGNYSCEFNDEEIKKNAERDGKRHKSNAPDLSDLRAILSRVNNIEVDI
jgi:hypothetical protein